MLSNSRHKSCLTLILVTQTRPQISQNSIGVKNKKRPITICSMETLTLVPPKHNTNNIRTSSESKHIKGHQIPDGDHYKCNETFNSSNESIESSKMFSNGNLEKFLIRTQSEDSNSKYCCKLEVKFVWYDYFIETDFGLITLEILLVRISVFVWEL